MGNLNSNPSRHSVFHQLLRKFMRDFDNRNLDMWILNHLEVNSLDMTQPNLKRAHYFRKVLSVEPHPELIIYCD